MSWAPKPGDRVRVVKLATGIHLQSHLIGKEFVVSSVWDGLAEQTVGLEGLPFVWQVSDLEPIVSHALAGSADEEVERLGRELARLEACAGGR